MMKFSMVVVCLVLTILSGYTQCNKIKTLKRQVAQLIGQQTLDRDEFNERLNSVEKALNDSTEQTKCCDNNIQSNENPTSQDRSELFVSKEEFMRLVKAFKEEKAIAGRIRRHVTTKLTSLDEQMGNISHDLADMCTATELHTTNTVTESMKNEMANLSQEVQNTKAEIADAIDKVQKSLDTLVGDMSETAALIKSIWNVIQSKKESEFQHFGKPIESLSDRIGKLENSSNTSANKVQVDQLETVGSTVSTMLPKMTSCLDHYEAGSRGDGVYTVYLKDNDKSIDVYCDMTTDGGGWTVFQRRKDGSVDFYRDWQDYKKGFGDLRGEFWLGNDNIAALTNPCCRELRIELKDFDNKTTYEKYGKFTVLPEHRNYKLYVDLYSGNAGDSLTKHNNMSFSTKDRDNDDTDGNCAKNWKGGWWYKSCYWSNLNGLYNTTLGTNSARIKRYNGNIWEYPAMTEMNFR